MLQAYWSGKKYLKDAAEIKSFGIFDKCTAFGLVGGVSLVWIVCLNEAYKLLTVKEIAKWHVTMEYFYC